MTAANDQIASRIGLPAELPADAKGYTKRLSMHMNFGEKGGSAVYSIHGPNDEALPIGYQYDTRKKGAAPTGFFIRDGGTYFGDMCKNWSELRALWVEFIKSRTETGEPQA